MQFSVLALSALVSLVAAAPSSAAKPTLFSASFYNNVQDCSGTESGRYQDGQGTCIDLFVPGTGSAIIKINQDQSNQPSFTLTGWTGKGCTGSQVVVQSQVDSCTSLNGVDVQSWSDGH